MRYLFFDVEGANCYNFVSKMCTFGYVITDSKFNVTNKVDVIMNPEAPFDKHIVYEKMNAYPLMTYLQRPAFHYFYSSIKHLLEYEDQLIVGWSIENDVKYVYDACKRYNKRQIKYQYFDIQKVIEIRENLPTSIKLETACLNYGIELMVTHKSDDDSFMTMAITKKVCELEKLTLEQLIEKYPSCLNSVANFSKNVLSDKEIETRKNRRSVYNKMNYASKTKHIKSEYFNEDSVVYFSVFAIDKHYDSIKSLINYASNCGVKFTKSIAESTIYVGTNKDIASHKGNSTFDDKTLYDIEILLENIREESKKK